MRIEEPIIKHLFKSSYEKKDGNKSQQQSFGSYIDRRLYIYTHTQGVGMVNDLAKTADFVLLNRDVQMNHMCSLRGIAVFFFPVSQREKGERFLLGSTTPTHHRDLYNFI